MKFIRRLTMVLVVLVTTDGLAQPPAFRGPNRRPNPPDDPVVFAIDANRDREISAQEIESSVSALGKLDLNNDGRLSRTELEPQTNQQPNVRRGFRAGGSNRVGSSGIRIGSPLPNVMVYGEDGNALAFASLKGSFSVVVFGCLT